MDRNPPVDTSSVSASASLSARRAWIEISSGVDFAEDWLVALRKESVDRNYKERPGQKARPKSLSARRAWIEISAITT